MNKNGLPAFSIADDRLWIRNKHAIGFKALKYSDKGDLSPAGYFLTLFI